MIAHEGCDPVGRRHFVVAGALAGMFVLSAFVILIDIGVTVVGGGCWYGARPRRTIASRTVIPGRAKHEPGISRFRVWCQSTIPE